MVELEQVIYKSKDIRKPLVTENLATRLDKAVTAYGMEISAENSKIRKMGDNTIYSDMTISGGVLKSVTSF